MIFEIFLTASWSGEPSWTTAKSHELTENVWCVDSDRKESSEPQDYPCFLTNRRGDIIELVDDLVLKG